MLPTTAFLLLLLAGLTYQEISLSCPSGWSHYASHCYKLVDQPMGFNDASRTCYNYGGTLARIFGFEENAAVGEIVKSVDAAVNQYWIGFTRQYLDDPTDITDTDAHWVTMEMDMDEASISEGFWAPEQPAPGDGACALVEFSHLRYYPYAWRMAECLTPLPFVCEAPAGLPGFYRCANGHYIRSGEEMICDDEDDCGDYSDEFNCPSKCRNYMSSEMGGTVETPGTYGTNLDCTWTLEAPVGKRIMLRFTEFNTEKDTDIVQLLIGGPTVSKSKLITRLSGNQNIGEMPIYYSDNNYMIIQFRSDSSAQASGFTFEWNIEPQFPGLVTELEASEASAQYITSPSYGLRVGAAVRESWVISIPLDRRVISLQVETLDLPDCAFINVYDGEDFSAPMLDYISQQHNPHSVISTGNKVHMYYHSCDDEYTEYTGFRISYIVGCFGVIEDFANYVVSPGYLAGRNYPNYQTCTWLILSPHYPKKIKMVFRSPFGLQDGIDTLTVYNGLDNSSSPIATLTGTSDPGSFISQPGHFYLVMVTSSIINARGFKLEYSEECPPPPFNDVTIYPDPFGIDIDDEFTVSCPTGYVFGQEEHLGEVSVTLIGKPGRWSVSQTPNCEPIWCGQAPTIEHGYFLNYTGSQYEDYVKYSCYAGYSINPDDTIVCQATGFWEIPPICVATLCPQLDNTLVNGEVDIDGEEREYGTVFTYSCDEGFQLDGVRRLICQGDGTWSDDVPSCNRLRCPVEMINEVFSLLGTLSPSSNVLFEDTVTAVCDEGYELVRAEDINIECLANQSFNSIPECEDVDECLPNSGLGPCDLQCTNTEGSFFCTCDPGYTLDADGTTCIDLDECEVGQVGYNYCVDCVDFDGGYRCECNTDGYILYADDGSEGFPLANNENGLLPGDVLYINHTCVRNLCPNISDPENGHALSYKTEFHFNDHVYFDCDLGYTLSGSQFTQCEANRAWSVDPATITCEVATCEIPDVSSLTYPPSFDAAGSVAYLTTVTVTCTDGRPSPLEFSKQCLYDQSDDTYQLYLNGSDVECPVIDCGTPELPSGSEVDGLVSDTIYGSTFTIQCQSLYQQEGDTTLGSGVVSCLESGKWDFGTLHCNGAACTDPGTEAGTQQNSPTTYDPGETVNYECLDEGFTLTGRTTLECIIDNTDVKWDGNPPTCVDNEDPVIVQELCGTAIEVDRLQPHNVQQPTVTDNTGATELSGIELALTPDSGELARTIAIASAKTLIYTATDFAGNTDTCSIQVDITDFEYPEITCPESYSVYIRNEESTQYAVPTQNEEATATDNQASPPTVTYSPDMVTLNSSIVDTWIVITATATDQSGNQASCQYMIMVQVVECSHFYLRDPVNGQTDCAVFGDGFTCSVTCDEGHYFHDLSDETGLVDTVGYQCSIGGDYGITDVTDCVVPQRSDYYIAFELEYDTNDGADAVSCLSQYETFLDNAVANVAPFLTTKCRTDINNDDVNVISVERDYAFDFDSVTKKLYADIYFKITPNTLTEFDRESCRESFLRQFRGFYDESFTGLKDKSGTASCPGLVHAQNTVDPLDLDPDTDSYGENLCAISVPPLVKEARNNVDDANNIEYYCFPCPPGTFYENEACTPCPLGFYQPSSGSTECLECPEMSSTYNTGSQTMEHCVTTCEAQPGFYSSNNLPPCSECPKDTYAKYDGGVSSCEPCDVGEETDGTGSTKQDDCKAPCDAGYYSDTGFRDCIRCPKHFYQPAIGEKTCLECPSDQVTGTAIPYTDVSDCLDGVTELCGGNVCQNGATCSVANHHVVCTCAEGYTGTYCQTMINYCTSNPCYYGGQCTTELGGFTCTCIDEGFTGDRCETPPEYCAGNVCSNGGMCKNIGTGFECICPTGYQGETCTDTQEVCLSDPCASHGTCRKTTARRRVCDCDDGWTGEICDINIDDCSTNPCLYGFPCLDGDNDYSCICDGGYAGKNCEVRPEDICGNDPCQTTGMCLDNYRQNGFVCICDEGYGGSTVSAEDTWLAEISAHAKLKVNGSCTIVNHCAGPDNQCTPEGTQQCTNTVQGPQCECNTGFSGSMCQHNIDDCAAEPCIRGDCTDGDNTYTCDCDFGYTGTNCESDIEDCGDDNPCVMNGTDTSQGTNGCEDKVGDYECFCKAGYRGKNCEIELNECMTFPCLHDGECTDGIDDFSCDCPEGWDGKRCEIPSEYCEEDSCANGAACLSLFADSFCQCSFPYYGEKCELEASTCRDANPCVDPDAVCRENSAGEAFCECSDDYVGQGCELLKNYCEDENFCLNGGTCRRSMELDEFDCECRDGYTGERCEEPLEDACTAVNCLNGGECIAVRDGYICRCPVGLDGPSCNKVRDTNWDLCFYDRDYVGMAYKSYAVPLGADLGEFSIGMWMRFSDLRGEGTFFTLYGLEYQNVGTPKRKLMELNSEEAVITFSRVMDPVTNNFGLYDINDRSWYYIMLTWVKDTGKLQLYVNSVRVYEVDGYAIGEDLPEYAMVLLGSELESEESLELTPEEESGFNGCVSHVFAWDVALKFNTEVPPMSDSRLNLVRQENLILDWKKYVTMNGVNVARPSTAGDNVCEVGFTGEDCTEPLPDKEPPTVEDCPAVVYKNGGDDRITQVFWEGPEFEGITGNVMQNRLSGSVFVWGKHQNVYVGYDDAGNAAVCAFDIYVRQDDCEVPENPQGGASACSAVGDDSWPFRTCSASCNSGLFSIPMPSFYTCGPQGNFQSDHIFFTSFVYPSCAVSTPRLVQITVIIQYLNIQACDDLVIASAFKIPIMQRIQDLNSLWKNVGTSEGAFCNGDDCNNIVQITTECVSQTARRRKRQALSDVKVTITIPNVQDPVESDTSVQSPEEVLTSDLLDNGGFDLDDKIPQAVPDEPSLIVMSDPICRTGQVLIGSSCVDCGPGTYYDNSSMTCMECPVGYYQELVGQDNCVECQGGTTTEMAGSQDRDDCHVSCPVGSYFDLDLVSCQLCELGFYQNVTGKFFCWPCDADETTPMPGSISGDSCYEYCEDGTELTGSGECQECDYGYYRTSGIQARCTQCEPGFVTPTTKARTEAECTIPDCQMGQKIVNDSCEDCPLGYFQNEKWQEECIECPGSQTTLQTASVDVNQCLFFCPEGQEEDEDNPSTCRPCGQGFFKDNTDPGVMCEQCDEDFVTPGEGATSEAECNVLSCDPGERASDDQSACIPCEIGLYQPNPYQDQCIPCDEGESTREAGADSMEDCEEFCPAGEQRDDIDDCVPCPIGYFRDTDGEDKFTMCELCPLDFITDGVGATDELACNIANCTAGQYLDEGDNQCQPCPKGEYQPDHWMTECIPCDPNGQKTTDGLGAIAEEECRLECQQGYEDPGIDQCEQCPIGYYKDSVGAARCAICDNGLITEETGATSLAACTVANCTAGTYRDTTNDVCVPCPGGTFEDRIWQEDECQTCPGDLTTLGVGADESDDCVTNCDSGEGYDLEQERCIMCARGFYRTQGVDDVCTMCDPEFITETSGAESSDDCNTRNCSAGTYLSLDNECVPCPRGEYQPLKWATSCNDCGNDYTTLNTGSTSNEDCILDCPLGEGYSSLTENCEICPRGTYKDAAALTCQDCPPGTTTVQPGSVQEADCSISECSVGRYAVGFDCFLCMEGTYEDRVGSIECKECPGATGKVTSPEGATTRDQCESTDECALGTDDCLDSEQGGMCEDLPMVGFRCKCRPTWEGTYPSCTHKCDLDYCKNGGTCLGRGTDSASCDCSEVDFEGDQCEIETNDTATVTEEMSYTNAIIGGAVGGGVGLILIILITVCCCIAFRGGEATPAKAPMMMGPTPFAYNSMPTGVILKQNPSLYNSSAGNLYYAGDGQSIAGYPGNNGVNNSKYMFYDEAENGAVNTFGASNPGNAFSNGTVNFEDDM